MNFFSNYCSTEQTLKRIYLDACALCRPYDDQSYTRIHLETTAVQLILRAIERGDYELFYSPVHEKEISAISNYQEESIYCIY